MMAPDLLGFRFNSHYSLDSTGQVPKPESLYSRHITRQRTFPCGKSTCTNIYETKQNHKSGFRPTINSVTFLIGTFCLLARTQRLRPFIFLYSYQLN